MPSVLVQDVLCARVYHAHTHQSWMCPWHACTCSKDICTSMHVNSYLHTHAQTALREAVQPKRHISYMSTTSHGILVIITYYALHCRHPFSRKRLDAKVKQAEVAEEVMHAHNARAYARTHARTHGQVKEGVRPAPPADYIPPATVCSGAPSVPPVNRALYRACVQ